jgi:hypothetical protein
MKVLQLIGGIVILFIFISCTNNNEIYKSETPDGSIRLRLNVQQRVSDHLLLEITELKDNRCPVGAVCSNPGFVQIGFRVFTDDGISNTELFFSNFKYGVPTIDTIMGHTIELVRVTPFPFVDKPLDDPDSYTVSLRVEEL